MEAFGLVENINWPALAGLRSLYLDESAGKRDYWTADLLYDYDLSFGTRIGWKWDYVLATLQSQGLLPKPSGPIWDWGCGSGIASRRLLAMAPELATERLWFVSDRSETAMDFATAALRDDCPGLAVSPGEVGGSEVGRALILVSHVLTELNEKAQAQLLRTLSRAEYIIWIEPGTVSASRALVRMRESMRASHNLMAPCGHQNVCGLNNPSATERNWCHFFAKAPAEAHHDPLWNRFADKLGIDWRSLPLSYLVLSRKDVPSTVLESERAVDLGLAREYKGYTKVLRCDASGIKDVQISHRRKS